MLEPVNSEKVDHPYPYFGLREGGHRKIRHDSLGRDRDKLNQTTIELEKSDSRNC